MDELKKQGIHEVKDVGLATLDQNGALTVHRKDYHQTSRSSFI